MNFHREKRRNDTHCSTTDPDAMLSRKSRGSGAVLAYRGHLLQRTATVWWFRRLQRGHTVRRNAMPRC